MDLVTHLVAFVVPLACCIAAISVLLWVVDLYIPPGSYLLKAAQIIVAGFLVVAIGVLTFTSVFSLFLPWWL